MIHTIKMNLDDTKRLSVIGKALSAEPRIEMLKKLRYGKKNINELAESLKIPASSAAAHVKVLEEAGLIKTELQPGIRGSMKLCGIALDHIYVEVNTAIGAEDHCEILHMPIGSFVDCKAAPTCGIVGEKGPIGEEDAPGSFYHPDRIHAKLLWFRRGYVEYRFPNQCLQGQRVKGLELSMELCSEDHEYNMDCPSDITLWVNGREVGTWASPADFGGRRGALNPAWWPDKNTQYGILKTFAIDQAACHLDGEKVGDERIGDFALDQGEYITVRIGIREDARHIGGVNLFGDCFGDYAQNIVMKLYFEDGQKEG